LTQTLLDQEKGIIEAALLQSKGKVAGAHGAAAKLGIPPSTLQSKIKQLKIDKERFNRSDGRRNQHRQSDSVVGPLETRSGS
jgi:formate hydrogenlyase transcriptional activator